MSGTKVKRVGVVGCGVMGSGIAQVVAGAGYSVYVSDETDEALERGLDSIRSSLARDVEKGRSSREEADETLGRIARGADLEGHAEADLEIGRAHV